MRNKRSSTAVQRWGAKALTLLLACALMAGLAITASARGDWQGEVVDPAIPKPVVTIQGNLVTEKGKPTGFYELALCVRSGRTITDLTGVVGDPGSVIDEAAYAAYIEANPSAEGDTTLFDIHYYPFRTATAAMNVNTDILTAVNWNLTSVTYETYNAATDSYPSDVTIPGKYPRGINTDPIVQGYAESGLSEGDAFPDITTPNLDKADNDSIFVALDVEGDPRMSTVQGAAEHFENDAALITLTASAPDNYPVVLKESTPLVVARFSYDLKRFSTTKVSSSLSGTSGKRNSITGDAAAGADGFWMGWDKTSGFGSTDFSGKRALTWLGESSGTFDFSRSDDLASRTQGDQTVWVHTGINNGSLTDRETYFYYYLGAEEYQDDGADTVSVKIGNEATDVPGVTIPKTEGQKVLTEGTDRNNGTPPAEYTYFKNLLRLEDKTLVVKLVNEPTFKRPANANDNIILFYDWDDTLIGSLAVGKGDVRAEVEAYVEENLVHPALRPGSDFMQNAGKTGVDLDKLASLQRDYTYRGKYAYTVGGDDVDLGVTNGKEYPLTNKLDYVFTKRVNTTLTQTENGAKVQYVHPYAMNDPALDPEQTDIDATEFPYVYGWAVVEDTRAFNGKKDAVGAKGDWKVMHDAAKLEDFWTTMGVGELSNMTSTVMTNTTLSTVAAVDPAAERFAPVFLKDADSSWADGTRADADDYLYTLSGENSYLRFADFSDITAELERYEGKNTLIVKAVYEEGPELMVGYRYQMTEEPYYNKLRNEAAANGGAYSMRVTLERASEEHMDGQVRGVSRVREAVVRQDTTVDQKWIEDANKGVDHDLENANRIAAQALTQTLFTKVDIDNGEAITFSLALSARQHRVDYWIIDSYNLNFVGGVQRSGTNYERTGSAFALDNYNYYMAGESDENDIYYDPVNYADREGSRGFVLYGTLNRMMELSTQVNRGGGTDNFLIGVAFDTMNDVNLRDGKGDPADVLNEEDLQKAILAAAQLCESNHYGDPDFWNSDLDCAELTYHQLQHYILGKGLLTRAAADADKISWCHLHKECAAEAAGVPKTWSEMVAAAQANDVAALEKMMPGDVALITNLRSNAAGSTDFVFNAGVPDNFANQFAAAVQVLDAAGAAATWDNVQYVLLNPGTAPADDSYARANYWWYDGATTNPAPSNLAGLVSMAKTAATNDPTLLPDGVTPIGQRAAKLRSVRSAFDSNNNGTAAVSAPWNRITENLVMDADISQVNIGIGSTTKFTDFDTFTSKLMAAVSKGGLASPATDANYWYKLQYAILHPDEPWPAALPAECEDYYWHNGGKLYVVKDIPSMLEVAKRMDSDNSAASAWNKFDFTVVQNNSELLFSQNFTGALYDASTMNNFKAAIATMVKRTDSPVLSEADGANATLKDAVWAQIQYYLIHNTVNNDDATLERNMGYYWWKDNGSPTAPVITAWSHFFNAAFLEEYNGNAKAWDNRDADSLLMEISNLRNYDKDNPTDPAIYKYSDLPMFKAVDLQTAAKTYVKTIVDAQIAAGQHAHTVPVPTWFELQHYLVNGSWDVSGISQADLETRYWWFDGKAEDPLKPVEAPDKPLKDWIAAHLGSDADITALIVNDFKTDDVPLRATVSGTAPTNITLTTLKNRLKTLVASAPNVSDLTWYQIQVALWPANAGGTGIGNGSYVSPAVAVAAYNEKKKAEWRPQWVIDFYDETTGLAKLSAMGDIVVNESGMTPEMERELAADDLRAQIEEMEKQLAAMKERLAQLEAAEQTRPEQEPEQASVPSTRPSAGTTTNTPAQPEPETPETPTEPETPAEPADPVVNDHDERVEIPLGEDAISATRTPIAADESGSGYGEPSGSVTPERTQTDMPVPLASKAYRIEALWKRRWVSVA